MDKLLQVLEKLLTDTRSLIILGGLFLFALGIVGEVKNYTPPLWWPLQVASALAGAGFMIAGIVLVFREFPKDKAPVVSEAPKQHETAVVRDESKEKTPYGIRILVPQKNMEVPKVMNIYGELQSRIPAGKKLWLLRIYPGRAMFVPLKEVDIQRDNTWQAPGCYLGGKAGDRRIIGAYVVDGTAIALFNLFFEASKHHDRWMDKLGVPKDEPERYLEPIRVDFDDMTNMQRADEVEVIRI